jgi:hypothetical protein
MVKVVIDGNRLFMEQSRMSTRTRDAGTRMTQMLEHECWNTDAGTRITQMLEHKCWNIEARRQMLKHKC